MSPSRSKTMVRPSGETSQLIQVPSSVSNSTAVTGPWSPSTSQGSFFFDASCAEAGMKEESAMQRDRRSAGNLLDTVSPHDGRYEVGAGLYVELVWQARRAST